MYIETEGIILKQHRLLEDRRMLTVFTKKYGKISSGAPGAGRNRTKSSLALKPFTLGRYELYKGKNIYNIQSCEVVKSFYKIGEDIEKYANASYALELTEKILPEEETTPGIYDLLLSFLEIIETRSSEYATIVTAYQLRLLACNGSMPHVKSCIRCNAPPDDHFSFAVALGGIVCKSCLEQTQDDALIYKINTAIINMISYILSHSLTSLAGIKIEKKSISVLQEIVKSYIKYHCGIGPLKSEDFILPVPVNDM